MEVGWAERGCLPTMNESNDIERLLDGGDSGTQSEFENTTPTIISRKEAIRSGLKRYYNGRKCKRGHRAPRLVSNMSCLQCVSDRLKRTTKTEQFRIKKRKWDKTRYRWQQHMHLWKNCQNRARARGLEFDIEPEDVVIPLTCPVLGIEIGIGSSGFSHNSPSVDRIIPEKGYVKGNIRVISMRANKLKSDATVDEMRAVLRYMEETMQ